MELKMDDKIDDKEKTDAEIPGCPPEEVRGRRRTMRFLAATGVTMFIVLVIAILLGIRARERAESKLLQSTNEAIVPEVRIIHPKQSSPIDEVVLPGATQPYINSPVYARASGYLVKWYHDIGSRVKKGDLLAVIEAPELDKQLAQAQADLETSKANSNLAKITADRWQGLIKTRSVSKQSTDQAVDNQKASDATVNSYAANQGHYAYLVGFEKLYAPFDGVITMRNTDNGWLITAGQNAPGQELFQIGQISTLRVFVAVPEVYSRAAHVGSRATLTLDEYPNQTFQGTITRTSSSIDIASRTLNTEVDIDNSKGLLLPGAYVRVHLALPAQIDSVVIPSDTLLFRTQGPQVGLVRNNAAQLVPITIGTDYGNSVQVTSGLSASDEVIESPSDSLVSGTPVRITRGASGADQ
jgi:RND family efflux transporter MFP subunit